KSYLAGRHPETSHGMAPPRQFLPPLPTAPQRCSRPAARDSSRVFYGHEHGNRGGGVRQDGEGDLIGFIQRPQESQSSVLRQHQCPPDSPTRRPHRVMDRELHVHLRQQRKTGGQGHGGDGAGGDGQLGQDHIVAASGRP
ncbi:unnamed protein product, partial [Discosporangium mesarthrocarpum]